MNRWFHPYFESDLISAAGYYNDQRPGLGGDFITAAEKAVEVIMTGSDGVKRSRTARSWQPHYARLPR
jgi:hypothetical protein